MFTIFGFYKFKKIKSLNKYKSLFKEELSKMNIRGTIIFSPEGLNGTIAGYKKNVNHTIKKLKKEFKFKDFDSRNISSSNFQPFHKGKIKINDEVFSSGDIFVIEPNEIADPKFLEDSEVIIVKLPSNTNDKFILER